MFAFCTVSVRLFQYVVSLLFRVDGMSCLLYISVSAQGFSCSNGLPQQWLLLFRHTHIIYVSSGGFWFCCLGTIEVLGCPSSDYCYFDIPSDLLLGKWAAPAVTTTILTYSYPHDVLWWLYLQLSQQWLLLLWHTGNLLIFYCYCYCISTHVFLMCWLMKFSTHHWCCTHFFSYLLVFLRVSWPLCAVFFALWQPVFCYGLQPYYSHV